MPMLHVTAMTEFPYTVQILEHVFLENGISCYTVKGTVGELHITLPEEDRFYALKIIEAMAGLSLVFRIRLYTREAGAYDHF